MDTRIFMLIFLSVIAANFKSTYQQQCVAILDVIIAVDGSNSMGEENFERQKTSIVNLVTSMNVSEGEVRVGLVLFSGGINAVINLTGDKISLINGIRQLRYPDEETRTDLALDKCTDMFQQQGRSNSTVPELILLITDGVSTMPALTIQSATNAKSRGINIFAIGVTNRASIVELRQIASMKNQNEYQVFVTDDFTTLEGSLNNATNRACVDLKCQDAMIDIVFVLDSSSNIGTSNFLEMKNFVHEFLSFADVDSGEIRVGIVTFSDTARLEFQLNTYRTKALMNSAINNIQYSPGATNMADALKVVRMNMFTQNNGDRSDVANVVILLSANDISINSLQTAAEADATRAAGIQIYGVGIGHRSTSLLDGIVSRPLEEARFMISSFSQLRPVIPEVYNKFNKFCENPPPVPACYMGITDLWFVIDVSRTTESLSRVQFTGDFASLKNGLTKMVEIAQDTSVSNPDVNFGLISFSDTSRILADVSQFNSVNNTASAIQQLPGGVLQGGATVVSALQNIVRAPVVSKYRSYVAIVAPESSYTLNMASLNQEMARLKALGYTIVIFAVRENGMLDQQSLQRDASGAQFFYYISRYSGLEAATKNFTRDRLCNGVVTVVENSTGLCSGSGHRENGVGVVAHPIDCDKYIQCYYDERNNKDIAVVRQCLMGLHWDSINKNCSKPGQARCSYDRCKESCEPYQREGSCRTYWDCENGGSIRKCCPENYAFVPGMGCQPDQTCKELCDHVKYCNGCQRKPNWNNPAGYDVKTLGGNMWMPRPCFSEDFDIVDCDCSVTRDQVCPADRVFDFSDVRTRQAIEEGNKAGIRVHDVMKNSEGIVLGNRSSVHVNVNHVQNGNESLL
uniref:VWFA domain-containing protein n=1 Tax=Arion vulgaris TaxID=1028688 RepID=A0A0B7A6Y2_9EUPU